MIIEKFEGNLEHFINQFKRHSPLVKNAIQSLITTALSFKLRTILSHIHEHCQLCINDIKLDNILYKEMKGKYLFVFADFGLTEKTTKELNEKCKQEDKKRLENVVNKLLEQLNME